MPIGVAASAALCKEPGPQQKTGSGSLIGGGLRGEPDPVPVLDSAPCHEVPDREWLLTMRWALAAVASSHSILRIEA